jgi:phosphoribosylformimino-5-aminoimidazole carboxamide ribotide isomerase
MLVIPAIDLKDGKCVRLRKGEFDTAHEVAADALETARRFEEAGAEWLHVVDLDGALSGYEKNYSIVRTIAENCGLRIELGGGLRSMEALDRADSIGVSRMVIGSAAVEDPRFLAAAVDKYGSRIAVGIDAKNGLVRTSGWTKSSGIDYIGFAGLVAQTGVEYIIFTDIDRDGMLSGPPVDSLRKLREQTCCKVIASGGISSPGDLLCVKELGVYGAIVGKAVYAGHVDLKEAILICR